MGPEFWAVHLPLFCLKLGQAAMSSILLGWSPSCARKLAPHRRVTRLVEGGHMPGDK